MAHSDCRIITMQSVGLPETFKIILSDRLTKSCVLGLISGDLIYTGQCMIVVDFCADGFDP